MANLSLREAAKHKISINAHEPVKDTGLRRTYPNWISREGARGQEYNAWGNPVNPPEHVAILPFTRMLAGPMDYTPGIVDLDGEGAGEGVDGAFAGGVIGLAAAALFAGHRTEIDDLAAPLRNHEGHDGPGGLQLGQDHGLLQRRGHRQWHPDLPVEEGRD